LQPLYSSLDQCSESLEQLEINFSEESRAFLDVGHYSLSPSATAVQSHDTMEKNSPHSVAKSASKYSKTYYLDQNVRIAAKSHNGKEFNFATFADKNKL